MVKEPPAAVSAKREQTPLELGCEGERDVPLRPLEQVGMPARCDQDVRQRVGGGDEIVNGPCIGLLWE